MKLKRRTSIIAGLLGVLIWSALFVLFYAVPHDYGSFSDIDFGRVRGERVQRFLLSPLDTVLVSRKADSEHQFDTLLLVHRTSEDGVFAYVLRSSEHVVFEKQLADGFRDASWNQTLARFELENSSTGEKFLLIPGKSTYILENAP